jgi:hypothetical protein
VVLIVIAVTLAVMIPKTRAPPDDAFSLALDSEGNARVYWLCPNATVMPAGNNQPAPSTPQECSIWSDVNSGFPGIALGVDVSFRNDNSADMEAQFTMKVLDPANNNADLTNNIKFQSQKVIVPKKTTGIMTFKITASLEDDFRPLRIYDDESGNKNPLVQAQFMDTPRSAYTVKFQGQVRTETQTASTFSHTNTFTYEYEFPGQ